MIRVKESLQLDQTSGLVYSSGMKPVNVQEAKTHLSRLISRVEAGEEVVIARYGKPVARLVAVEAAPAERTPGSWKGELGIREDFDEPMDEQWLEPLEPDLP